MRVYALLEAAVGGLALAAPLLAAGASRLIALLGPHVADGAPLVLLRLGAAALVLLPPTVLMGATFPVLVRAWTPGDGDRGTALLYGWNTLGAGCGALFGSFAALPLLGTRGTFVFGGMLNLAAAVAASRMTAARSAGPALPRGADARSADARAATRSTAAAQPDHAPRPAASGSAPAQATGLLPLLFLAAWSGAVGAVLQAGWTRVMTLAFGSSVYALGLTLGAVIIGLGLGPLVVARRGAGAAKPRGRGSKRRPAGTLDATGAGAVARRRAARAAWLTGAASLAILPLLGGVPALAARASGLYERSPLLALGVLFGVAATLLIVPAMAQGACLPLLAAAGAVRAGIERASGSVYAASTAGSVAGFLLSGFVLLPALGARLSLVAAAVAALGLAVFLDLSRGAGHDGARGSRRDPGRGGAVATRPLAMALAKGGAPLLLLLLPAWDAASMSGGGLLYGRLYGAVGADDHAQAVRRRGQVLYERDGGDGLVTVRRNAGGILSLQINGKTEASSGADMATQLLAGHLPLMLHGGARDALVIGLASGVSLGAAARHPLDSLAVIEIARAVPGAARLFDEVNGRVLDDPRAVVVLDDARAWLLARPRTWDVIASQPSNPWVAGVAGLFTTDMYRLLRERLRPGGIVAQWVQAYRIAPDDLRGIVASFLEVFPDATLWEESPGGGDLFLVGGLGDRGIDPARLAAAPAGAWEDLARGGIDGPADLLARFVAGPRALGALARGARRHTDDNLYLEWRAPLALLRDAPLVPALLRREREPPASILAPGNLERDPALAGALRALLRRRDERLAAAAGLKEADLMVLREPSLAAGLALLGNGRYIEAIGALGAATAATPDSATAQFLLGEAYRGAGLHAAAAVAYEAAVELDPGLADAWNALGVVRLAIGLIDEARQAFEAAVTRGPGLASARNNLASMLLREGDLAAAEEALRAALAIDPDLAAAHANLGLVARRRGDLRAAEAGYRRAIAADPLNADARYNLAVVLKESGRAGEAAVLLRGILAGDPADAEAAGALRTIEGDRPAGGV